MKPVRVLISGGGIGGLTLAFWLERYGLTPIVIERAGGLRGGGYMLDFWGLGFDVAERMAVLPALADAHYPIPTIDLVDSRNRIHAQLQVQRLRKQLGGRHLNLLRSDLERVLHDHIKDRVEVRFSASIRAIHQDPSGVDVDLGGGHSERCDLVIGADGLRSNVRRMVFGPDDRFERFLGYYAASFTIPSYLAHDDVFRSYTQPHRQVAIYAVADRHLAALFVFRAPQPLPHLPLEGCKQALREAFADVGWETPRLLERLDDADDFYFDAVSQIEMPVWSAGRVALLGDACQCVSLMSGQGSGLAMAGAYVLAGELSRSEQFATAFGKYQALLQPEIARKQQMARRFASSFVPASAAGICLRNGFVKLMTVPVVSRFFIRRFLSDELVLEDYAPVERKEDHAADHHISGLHRV